MVTTHPQFSWTNLTMEISENVWNLFKAKNKDTKMGVNQLGKMGYNMHQGLKD